MMEFTATLDLGSWLGKRQAFGLIANKCSAADAECLKRLRDSGVYRQLNLTWEEFCPKYLHISRSYADRLIQQREEFGAIYFQLSELVGISAATYRRIAAAVNDGHIEHGGEKIRICAENSEKIVNAVTALRQEAAQAK